jgi:hypothetical protein
MRSVGDDQRCQSADRDRRAPNTGLQRFYTLWAKSGHCWLAATDCIIHKKIIQV